MNHLADIQIKKKLEVSSGKRHKNINDSLFKTQILILISGPGIVMEIDVVNQKFSGNAQVIYLPRKHFL